MVLLPGSSGARHIKASGKCKVLYRYEAINVIGKTIVVIRENDFKMQQSRLRLGKRKNFLTVRIFFSDKNEGILEAMITLKDIFGLGVC